MTSATGCLFPKSPEKQGKKNTDLQIVTTCSDYEQKGEKAVFEGFSGSDSQFLYVTFGQKRTIDIRGIRIDYKIVNIYK